ncbi:MAG: ribosome small subunit-dependent GTPase A [Gammaproteobacteria bacterium]|nr:ribosome small subunit-dependent GTPase A [Gammaproteobacteria bacterium]
MTEQDHPNAPPEVVPAVVVSHLRSEVEVATLSTRGEPSERLRCFQRSRSIEVVTGDRVLIERDPEHPERGVINEVQPRRSLLQRRNRSGVVQTICANLDLLLITIAPDPQPHADLVDRYLVAAELDDLKAAVVLNKCDLAAAGAPDILSLIDLYESLGIPVFRCSAVAGIGLDALRDLIGERTAALVGQSGVGKSSLLNALLPEAAAEVGTLTGNRSRGHGRGRHTTSTVRLYPIAGGVIIDSPGIRELTPEVTDRSRLITGFPEIDLAARRCRFRNCRHDREPDCGVSEALAAGHIDGRRWRSYRILEAELGQGRR